MKAEWNEKTSQSIAKKIQRMKQELGGERAEADKIAEILEKLHPEVSAEVLHKDMQEIDAGIQEIYQTETEKMHESAAKILAGQMEGMTEEQRKGFLSQLFDSVKLSDEDMDEEIEKAEVDGRDLAQMSMEELQALVAEQLVNSIKGMASNTMEDNREDISSMDAMSLRTEEDALLLAAAQYSEALEGNIPFEYTKVPRVLGQCAAAQVRIVIFCEGMTQTEFSEDEKRDKIVNFIVAMLAMLVIFVFGVVIAGVAATLLTATFSAVSALLGTGIIAFVTELILLYPIMWVSFAVVLGAGSLFCAAGKGVYEFFKEAAPKMKQFYGKLAAWVSGKNPFKGNKEDSAGEEDDWDIHTAEETAEEAYEEEDNLAYT